MDFKSLMAARIAKAKDSSSAATTTSANKYQRRSEQEAAREKAYAAEQKRLEAEREERAAKKRKLEEEEAEQNEIRDEKRRKLAADSKARREAEEAEQERLRRKRLGLPELPEESQDSQESTPLPADQTEIPEEKLQSKLRSLNEPAKLYNESHTSRLRRYYKLTTKSSTITTSTPKSKGPIPTTLQQIPSDQIILPTSIPPKDTAEYTHLHNQLSSYFTLILTEWSKSLSERPPEIQESTTGKAAFQTYQSVLRDLTPFYRKLETQTITNDLLGPIVEIARNAQARKYVDANDGYLRLSIGKAAWPIGVTMVGIHERSAREKIHADGGDKLAHIMSDEVTRKILQSIKRCLSYVQTRWPPYDVGQLMG